MTKLFYTAILGLALFSNGIAQTEKTYNMKEVVVTAGRSPVSISTLSRSISVFQLSDIKRMPVNNFQDLLKYVAGVDLRARGIEGVQADVSIRGGSFEQTLVMIDGVKLIDPQTGHHNLNLPISLESIQKIEVLKGQGARAFGANAFSGAINVITKKEKSRSLNASLLGGNYGLLEANLSGTLPISDLTSTITFSKKKSDGYKPYTNFDMTNFSLMQSLSINKHQLNFLFGYTDKKFGANSFYSDRFPFQWERTITRFANLNAQLNFESFKVTPKLYYRNNYDDYRLDNTRPDWYRNIHFNKSYGGEIEISFASSLGTTSLGGEFSKEEINSSNLGSHNRNRGGIFAEHYYEPFSNLSMSAGFFAYNYSSIGWKLWPGFDISYRPIDNLNLFASVGKAFRMPTFTELYYKSPANMGNPNLVYEQTTNYELGVSYNNTFYKASASYFVKEGKDLVDWVRRNKNEPWIVENVADLNTTGLEINLELKTKNLFEEFFINSFNISYTFLSSNRKTGNFESKYLLDHLKNQIVANINHNLPFSLNQTWIIRYEERENYNKNFIVDSQISASFNSIDVFIRASNVFNNSNYDVVGVPLPGRWISAGVKYRIEMGE